MAEIASAQTLMRAAMTAFIVIIVALSVDRFGPLIGGALAGLPIVLGPGFFFLLREQGAEFTVASATYALFSLIGTQGFLLSYIAAASRYPPGLSLLAASMTWFAFAVIISYLPASLILGGVLFGLSVFLARLIGGRFRRKVDRRTGVGGPLSLILRGFLAGLLVAGVTGASTLLGPHWAGLLLAYPIGFTVISITIQQRLGADTVIATLHSGMLGAISLAAFLVSLVIFLPVLGAMPAFALSMLLALSATTIALFSDT